MKIVLLGPPGAGKGTLAALLKDSLTIEHISTGDILREEIKNETDLGMQAKAYIEKGELVPDELVTKLVENKLSSVNNFMLDGFPRTRHQAEDLDKILKRLNKLIDYVVYMDAREDLIVKRLSGRRICKNCGAVYHIVNRPPKQNGICDVCSSKDLYQRADDNEETVKNRLGVYFENTLPIVYYYDSQGVLLKVDGNKESEQLSEQLLSIFNEG